jgi:hypothetical protein
MPGLGQTSGGEDSKRPRQGQGQLTRLKCPDSLYSRYKILTAGEFFPAVVSAGIDSQQERERAVTKDEILAKLQSGELSVEQASQQLAALETPKRGQLYCKVSEKGGVSVYGLQRMPVTLYMEQWDRLLTYADEIKAFISANSGKLKRKGE